MAVTETEDFKPIPVAAPAGRPIAFALRCLVDLQLATIVQPLRPALAQLHGKVLDVGAGQSPWRDWLPPAASYQGIDVGHAGEFGMQANRDDLLYYDGRTMPLADGSFDAALCIEVMEHAESPEALLAEIARVLRPQGRLLLTVPWSARRHHVPHDYHRFTSERLHQLLATAGFLDIDIRERGNDIGAIANKLVVLALRLARPRQLLQAVWTWPLLALVGPVTVLFVIGFHCSAALGLGSREDPLGYFASARRAGTAPQRST